MPNKTHKFKNGIPDLPLTSPLHHFTTPSNAVIKMALQQTGSKNLSVFASRLILKALPVVLSLSIYYLFWSKSVKLLALFDRQSMAYLLKVFV